ncbi:cAMP-dependent protein kinase type II regulatory subunit-like [Agrilus planipennis]|uniref:cAMP-dependent protein kinase type II regulatory subunit-like n=1 Tax=Agrilus planipennis TaxID=224129 RepID=A0A1W4X6P0_AGRPL|nr:cAMP-dependent protein kinase type II regulatory subunit-like [Agrilus planipennis]
MNGFEQKLPEDFQSVIYCFALSHMIDKPSDVISYAADYFQRLREARRVCLILGEERSVHDITPMEEEGEGHSIPDPLTFQPDAGRRKCVAAEQYDPEKDDEDYEDAFYPKNDQQKNFLWENIKNLLLFSSLEDTQIERVVNAMFEVSVVPGDVIIEQGDDADNFYVIESGIYNVYISSGSNQAASLVHTYNNRGYFGELALLYNQPRAATVKAVVEGTLWALSRQEFRHIVLRSAYRKRKMYETFLEEVPLLQNLTQYDRMNLADALVPKYFKPNERIIQQGDTADGMYFVEDGTVVVTMVNDNGIEIELTTLGKGEYFGELALITKKPRAASVTAYDNVKVAFLDVKAFERLLGPCIDILKKNMTLYEAAIKAIGS